MRDAEKKRKDETQEASSSPISYPEKPKESTEKEKETKANNARREAAKRREKRRIKALGGVPVEKVAEHLKVKQGEKVVCPFCGNEKHQCQTS